MGTPTMRFVLSLCCAIALSCKIAPCSAQQSPSAYRYSAPAGWTHSVDGDVETLTPQSVPAGTAQLMLLAPKPASGPIVNQFEAERTSLEQFWGLRAPLPVPTQSGRADVGEYVAYFASYDSDGGPRYMAFMALSNGSKFGLLVFVAATDQAFNQLAPEAVRVFRSLSLQ